MGVEELENKLSCRFPVQFLARWQKGGLQQATYTSPCYSQWRALLDTPCHSEPQDTLLGSQNHDASQSCRLLDQRKRRPTSRKDQKWHFSISLQTWNFFTTNILRNKQKNLRASCITVPVLSGGRGLGQGLPRPRATGTLVSDAGRGLIWVTTLSLETWDSTAVIHLSCCHYCRTGPKRVALVYKS